MKLTQEQAALADELNGRQKLFVFGLMSGKTQRQAYYDAGGTAKTNQTADACASEILSKPKVKAFYDSLMGEVAEEAKVDATYVLKTIQETIERCKQAIPVMSQDGGQAMVEDADGELHPMVKFDPSNVLKGAELLGKHLGMFKDNVVHSGPNGGDINVTITRRVID